MIKSESIKEIAKALADFQGNVKPVKKSATNPFFNSKYATLENILEAIRQPLREAGLSFSQFPNGEGELVTILMHTSGEFFESNLKLTPKDQTPQAQGSAITYMRRYALSAILGIATEDDDDGNSSSAPKKTPARPAPKAKPKGVEIEGLGVLPPPDEGIKVEFECAGCGEPITEAEDGYSRKFWGKPLCRNCQKTEPKIK